MRQLPANAGSGHKFPRKNSEEHRNHLRTMEKHVKLHTQDWRNVVVCNLHPFPIQSNFGDAGLLVIKRCEEGMPYYAHLIDMYRLSKADKGNADYEPIEILPIEQAVEIVKKYEPMGGVFWHYADEPVPVNALKDASANQLGYYRRLVRMGRDEWSRYHSMARISDAMRQAARYLARLGEVNLNEFEWVEKIKLPICQQCGEDYKPEAKVCKHCDFPIDVEWVRRFRKDLVAKFDLGLGDGHVVITAAPAPTSVEEFLNEAVDPTLGGSI